MPLIKRYSNRKLYNTEENRYINLEVITQMIQEGADVQVIENDTGEDITAVTFAQIIMERERKERDFVPRSILAELIKAGGESINSVRQKLISSADLIQRVDQEITTRLESLIQLGEIAEEEANKIRDRLLINSQQWLEFPKITDNDIEAALLKHGIATKSDLQKIIDQVERLYAKIDKKNHQPE